MATLTGERKRALGRKLKNKLQSESDLASAQATRHGAAGGGPQAQTVRLANEISEHISLVHGTIWLMHFRDALSILDVAKLLCMPINTCMQQADAIKKEIRRWADIGR